MDGLASSTEPKLRISVSAISRYLAGEVNCAYRLWRSVREHAPEFEVGPVEYVLAHAHLLHALAAERRTSELEAEKLVRLHQPPLTGKIDLVEITPIETVVWEVKSGKPRGSHLVQTLVYLWLGQALGWDGPLRGAVRYPDKTVAVPEADLAHLRKPLRDLLRLLLDAEPPEKVRGMECSDCLFVECTFNPRRLRAGENGTNGKEERNLGEQLWMN